MKTQPPLVIDNGSYQIKFGYAQGKKDFVPMSCHNCIAKTSYVGNDNYFIGNQINTNLKSSISGVYFKRPIEKGQLTSWELEQEVWDYCFYNPDEFSGFELNNDPSEKQDLILSETIFTLPELSRNTDQIVFEEYAFDSLYKAPTAAFVPFNKEEISNKINLVSASSDLTSCFNTAQSIEPSSIKQSYNDFQLVIDSGFNATWVIPIIKGVIHYKAVKKCDIGGRFLTGLLKEMVSFRHYDVSDETLLINNIKEQCCFMSPQSYTESFQNKQSTVVEYVLPDFHSNSRGFVLNREEKNSKIDMDVLRNSQSIQLTDELFSVPETIFYPEIAQLVGKPGLIEVIMESLSMLPEVLRPLLVGNIVLIGGNFNIPNMKQRLCKELQAQCPTDWEVRASCSTKDPSNSGFESMAAFSDSQEYQNTKVTREEYLENGADWISKNRFGYQQWV